MNDLKLAEIVDEVRALPCRDCEDYGRWFVWYSGAILYNCLCDDCLSEHIRSSDEYPVVQTQLVHLQYLPHDDRAYQALAKQRTGKK